MDVGVRELRNSLSRHLATVRGGQSITVTDHGRPVARLVPIDAPSALERLIAEGRITPAPQRKSSRPAPASGTGEETVSDLVEHQRR